MKKISSFILTISLSVISFSQGLKGEMSFDDGYTQRAEQIVCNNEYSYSIIDELKQYVYVPNLRKIDTLGTVLWSKPISSTIIYGDSEYSAGLTEIHQLKNGTEGGVFFTAWAAFSCDYPIPSNIYVCKLDEEGDEVWLTRFNDSIQSLGLSELVDDSEIFTGIDYLFVKVNSSNTDVFFELNQENGEIINAFYSETIQGLKNIKRINGELYGLLNGEIVKFNTEGEIIETIALTDNFIEFHDNGSQILANTYSGELTLFDTDFSEINTYAIDNNHSILKIKTIDNHFNVLMETDDDFTLLIFDENLNVNSEKHFNLPEGYQSDVPKQIDFNSTRFDILYQHQLAHSPYKSVRYIYYSVNDPIDEEIPWVDVEIEDIDPYEVVIFATDPVIPSLHRLQIKAKALVKNNSSFMLNSVKLNHFIGINIVCGSKVYNQEFHDLDIAPGESKWIDMGLVHDYENTFGGTVGDSSFFNLCVYSSNPNRITDINIENDKLCQPTFLGVLDIEKHHLTNQEKKVIKIVNLLGQEVKPEPNKLLIYIFEDGTSEKRILTE